MNDENADKHSEPFDSLVMKALGNELSPEERVLINEILASDSGKKAEFQRLCALHSLMQEAGAVNQAVSADSPAPSRDQTRRFFDSIGLRGKEEGKDRLLFFRYRSVVMSLSGLGIAAAFVFMLLVDHSPDSSSGQSHPELGLGPVRGDAEEDDSVKTAVPSAKDGVPVAFLLDGASRVDVKRGNSRFTPSVGDAVFFGDVVELESGVKATLLMPDGPRELQGPIQHEVIGTSGLLRVSSLPPPSAVEGIRGDGPLARVDDKLFAAPAQTLASVTLNVQRASQGLDIYAPVGEISILSPLFVWEAQQDALYDVRLVNNMDPAQTFEARSVTSPLRLMDITGDDSFELDPGGFYKVTIHRQGSRFGRADSIFIVAEGAVSLASGFSDAELLSMMAELLEAGHWSDILALGELLQGEARNAPLAIRLRLIAHANLGHADAYHELVRKLSD